MAMNHDAVVCRGQRPWSPNPQADGLDVWNQFDHPLTGTFLSDGEPVLFTIVGGLDARITVWAYTCLTQREAQKLAAREFDSVNDLREFVEKFFKDRRIVLALADDLRIRYWGPADSPKGALYDRAIDFLNGVLNAVMNQADASTMFRAKLAQVDVATAELIDA